MQNKKNNIYNKLDIYSKCIFWFNCLILIFYWLIFIGLSLYLFIKYTEVNSNGIFVSFNQIGNQDLVDLILNLLGIDNNLKSIEKLIKFLSSFISIILLSKAIIEIRKIESKNLNIDKILFTYIFLCFICLYIDLINYDFEIYMTLFSIIITLLVVKLAINVKSIQKNNINI